MARQPGAIVVHDVVDVEELMRVDGRTIDAHDDARLTLLKFATSGSRRAKAYE